MGDVAWEERARRTRAIKELAREIGFHLVGITTAEPFEQGERKTLEWLGHGHQGGMAWMNGARARLAARPKELLPGAHSLVMLGVSYRTEEPAETPPSSEGGPRGRIARYAWGDDYHDAMRVRLHELRDFLGNFGGTSTESRTFVDSGPLLERDAAIRAGLGFRGKNTNLLTAIGSFVFLGAVLTTLELVADDPPPPKDCGSCRLCIDACPTDALATPYHLAAERCIAYLTIEHKGPIPEPLRAAMGPWVFGCDICQDVCPYNRSTRNRPTGWEVFSPRPHLGTAPDVGELLRMDDETFRTALKGSPLKRAKRKGLARNAAIALGNSRNPRGRGALEQAAAHDDDPDVREAATWALNQLARDLAEK